MDKGAKLNKRVWKVFSNAGFYTEPNANNQAERLVSLSAKKQRPIDLHATDETLGVTIIGSNKSGDIKGWTAHVNDHEELRKCGNYSKLLFVITGKQLDDSDLEFAH